MKSRFGFKLSLILYLNFGLLDTTYTPCLPSPCSLPQRLPSYSFQSESILLGFGLVAGNIMCSTISKLKPEPVCPVCPVCSVCVTQPPPTDNSGEIASLNAQIAALQAQVDGLSQQNTALQQQVAEFQYCGGIAVVNVCNNDPRCQNINNCLPI